MIELIAEGPVKVCKDGRFGPRKDGHDTIQGSVELTRETVVRVDVEFEQGHVNLEGYAPSYVGWPVEECVGGFVSEAMDLPYGMLDYQDREWTVKLEGDWWDWIQQAHRYQTERPSKSILDCLSLFKMWDETKESTILAAINRAKEATGLVENDLRDLSDRDYKMMRQALNELDRVGIPESYSD